MGLAEGVAVWLGFVVDFGDVEGFGAALVVAGAVVGLGLGLESTATVSAARLFDVFGSCLYDTETKPGAVLVETILTRTDSLYR